MIGNFKWIAILVGGGVALASFLAWLILFKTPTVAPVTEQPSFGTGDNTTTATLEQQSTTNGSGLVSERGIDNSQQVFKVADGPVAGAVLLQTTRPTSTIARYIMQTNGHAFDIVLDSPGAVAKSLSNTTLPGIARIVWSEAGRGAVAQYLDQGVIKTVHFGYPASGASSTVVRIQFLPPNISSIAASPDGSQITYIVPTTNGVDGYTSNPDGGAQKKLFSLPLSQVSIMWPSPNTLLVQSASAASTPGVLYSIDAKSGSVTPLLYANGLSATANRTFSRVVYQTVDSTRNSYAYDVRSGLSKALSFDPIPEACRWSPTASSTLYCAAPVSAVPANYLDLWHLGAASAPSTIVSFDTATGLSNIIAIPGQLGGGEPGDATDISISPDEKYLLYVRKGDRSVWAVRL